MNDDELEKQQVYEVVIRLRSKGMTEEYTLTNPLKKDPDFRMFEKYAKRILRKCNTIHKVEWTF